MNRLIIASAGAGKTQTIVDDAVERSRAGQKVLILTYTENNQTELVHRLGQGGGKMQHIHVKGWFSFLLEDMIRPYQQCILSERVSGTIFDESDPHKRNSRNIPGLSEKPRGVYNPAYFVSSNNNAHTHYLSKLAFRVCEETGAPRRVNRKLYKTGLPVGRLEQIYDAIFIDEVQDLVGWDYELIRLFSVANETDIVCVGDFRQTVYRTTWASKKPTTNTQKMDKFRELGFEFEHLNISRRCIQDICGLADSIYDEGYPETLSHVDTIPDGIADHRGLFAVRRVDFEAYMRVFDPMILRVKKDIEKELCAGRHAVNFGASKGMGFDRTLIIPTGKQRAFISGDPTAFAADPTDKPKNLFYVGVTRARYSVAFVHDGEIGIPGMQVWTA